MGDPGGTFDAAFEIDEPDEKGSNDSAQCDDDRRSFARKIGGDGLFHGFRILVLPQCSQIFEQGSDALLIIGNAVRRGNARVIAADKSLFIDQGKFGAVLDFAENVTHVERGEGQLVDGIWQRP